MAGLVCVVLAAGAGTRLRPLTFVRPKALCPVLNVPLVDHALARARRLTTEVAVNIHHGRALLEPHLAGRARLSIEEPAPLGTAGALGRLRDWIEERDVLVLNADAYHPQALAAFAGDWDRDRVRLLTVPDQVRPDFGEQRYAGAALLPWRAVRALAPEFSGLYETTFAPALQAHRLELVPSVVPFFDCGTPRDYHAANMAASAGANVVAPDAVIEGEIVRTVVWPGATVHREERLTDAVRASDEVTVVV